MILWRILIALFALNLCLSFAERDWLRVFGFAVVGVIWVFLRDDLTKEES